MAHDEHNRTKKGKGFFLIILGALLLIIAPTIYPTDQILGVVSFVAGFIIGGLGFYIRFIKKSSTS